jgi:hypothetical protein
VQKFHVGRVEAVSRLIIQNTVGAYVYISWSLYRNASVKPSFRAAGNVRSIAEIYILLEVIDDVNTAGLFSAVVNIYGRFVDRMLANGDPTRYNGLAQP